jgi:glucose-fructose oxidoreductase
VSGRRWRIAGLGFHHGHIAEQLRIARDRDDVELVAVFHPERARLDALSEQMDVPPALRHDDVAGLWAAEPDIVVVCSATADHARWVEEAAAHGAHVLVEKPFASSAAEARRMIAATRAAGRRMVVNWPLAYYPAHRTTRRLIAEGAVGEVRELHYYDGNRGPFSRHDASRPLDPADAWWFDPAAGGGALQDYLGYGVTLATWFLDGALPSRVTAVRHLPAHAAVDTHAAVTAEYPWGLATFQARWGTLTDPWIQQSLPRTGFVVVGTDAAIASHDYAPAVRLHDRAHPDGIGIPVDTGTPTALAELVDAIADRDPEGPASPALSLGGQRIVDAAVASAERGVAVDLEEM